MTVAKVVEVKASSSNGVEDAVRVGLKKMSGTVKGIKGAWVKDIEVVTDDAGAVIEWRVDLKVSFMVQ